MAAAAPTALYLDSSLRSILIPTSTSPSISVSLHRSHSPPHLSISSIHSPPEPTASSPSAADLDLYRFQILKTFKCETCLCNGRLEIRPMDTGDVDLAVQLLAESFAESLSMPRRYVPPLAFFVRQYMVDRSLLLPHSAVLLGFYVEDGKAQQELVCTAEVSFDVIGAYAAPPTPPAPTNYPYICNMAVKKNFRRRGIGSCLLKTCEELISQMKTLCEVYLHCRVADTGPLRMYKKAGYKIVKTDSRLVWLTLQRRKHLLVKELFDCNTREKDASFKITVGNLAN